jgi:acetoin utilization deacetylase AcuC-like enzyme
MKKRLLQSFILYRVCSGISLSSHLSSLSKFSTFVQFYYNDIYEVDLPPNHRFPMEKYRKVRKTVQAEYENNQNVVWSPSPLATFDELSTTHCKDYITRYMSGNMTPQEVRKAGFPWSQQHVNRSLSSVGGTVAATRFLLSNKQCFFAGHVAGGTHHAFYDYGEGFCIFNDIAVACNIALLEFGHIVKKIVIIDLDVHQGNGTATLFYQHPQVFTFNIHCKENIFSAKQISHLDIEVPAGIQDEEYLQQLKMYLPYLTTVLQPDLVFFQAGVDIYQNDKLGKMKITRNGIQERNRLVFETLKRHHIQCVVTMGGGYPLNINPQSIEFQEIIQCHADVYRNCIETAKSD